MATWTGLGDNTELFWAILSHPATALPREPRNHLPAPRSRDTHTCGLCLDIVFISKHKGETTTEFISNFFFFEKQQLLFIPN
jgi:hypothetical protein